MSRILSEADMAARPGQYDRLVAIANEVAALTRWKDEAIAVIEAWERVHALLGEPGLLGESKAEATWVEVRDLLDARSEADRDRNAARAEIAALRALVAEGIEAFRLTKEYVNIPDENGFVLLPDVEGWSHWDWTLKARDALLKREEADRG